MVQPPAAGRQWTHHVFSGFSSSRMGRSLQHSEHMPHTRPVAGSVLVAGSCDAAVVTKPFRWRGDCQRCARLRFAYAEPKWKTKGGMAQQGCNRHGRLTLEQNKNIIPTVTGREHPGAPANPSCPPRYRAPTIATDATPRRGVVTNVCCRNGDCGERP